MMDIVSIEWKCFLEASRHGSFSSAARQLRLTQPSVTKYIRKLEENLGAVLFQRTNRGIRLTETGKRLSSGLRAAEAGFDQAARSALRAQEEVSGRVTLGAHRIIALCHLCQPLTRLYREHPGLRFDLQLATSVEVGRRVAAGELDYGLVANPQPLPGLVARKCAEESVGVFRSRSGSLRDVSRVLYNPEMRFLSKVLKNMKGVALEPVPDYEVIAAMAAANPELGALVPDPVARRSGLDHRVSPVFYRASICLVYRTDLRKSARHRAIFQAFNPRRC